VSGFPLDYSYKDVRHIADFLHDDPFTGIAKGMDRGGLPRNATCNATGVRLANNRLENLDGLSEFLKQVLDDTLELRWLDLSNNKLTKVDPVLLNYPNLSCLYLQGNQINTLREIDKLSGLTNLSKITIQGNPVQSKKNYRTRVTAVLPKLRSLDVIAVTKEDRVRANIYGKIREEKMRKEEG